MWIVGGAVTGLLWTAAIWTLGQASFANANHFWRLGGFSTVLVVAAMSGFLAGSSVCRRARVTVQHLALFSSLSWAMAGSMAGAAFGMALTAAYVQTFVAWPQDIPDQVLLVLSYPAFGGLGLCLGAAIGLLSGYVVGFAMQLAMFRRSPNRIF